MDKKLILVVFTSDKPTNPTKFTTRYVPNAANLMAFLKKHLKVSALEFGVVPDAFVYARGVFDDNEYRKVTALLDINKIVYSVNPVF